VQQVCSVHVHAVEQHSTAALGNCDCLGCESEYVVDRTQQGGQISEMQVAIRGASAMNTVRGGRGP
jgi:hypothetical protein